MVADTEATVGVPPHHGLATIVANCQVFSNRLSLGLNTTTLWKAVFY